MPWNMSVSTACHGTTCMFQHHDMEPHVRFNNMTWNHMYVSTTCHGTTCMSQQHDLEPHVCFNNMSCHETMCAEVTTNGKTEAATKRIAEAQTKHVMPSCKAALSPAKKRQPTK